MVWRAAIVAALLALWLTVGIAWGGDAALVFGFFVFVSCIYALWAITFGRLTRNAGGGYYARQMEQSRWRGGRSRFFKRS
jgi:hypothetical protein